MITNREDFFKQLDFVGKTKRNIGNHNDISIYSSMVDGGEVLTICIRNGLDQLLGEGDRVKIARYKNRLIIIKDEGGKKLFGSKSRFVRFRFKDDQMPTYKYFEGDYELKYDDLYEYYYIEKKEDGSAAN